MLSTLCQVANFLDGVLESRSTSIEEPDLEDALDAQALGQVASWYGEDGRLVVRGSKDWDHVATVDEVS